jgi:hypothetical protein
MTDYFDSLKLKIAPILLTNPEHFHISSLTKKAKKDFLAKTDNYNGYNKPFIDFVRNKTKKYINHDFALSKKVIRHLEYFDKVRKNSYKDIIPIDNLH